MLKKHGPMSTQFPKPGMDPYEFIHEHIDSVPHLEALILFWNSRPVGWTCDELASRLYVPAEQVTAVIRDLVRLQLVQEHAGSPPRFSYFQRSDEQNELMRQVDDAYRRDLVRISTMVHSKASSPVREFARAFRFRKDKDQ
jgi:predicted ArsR family transcriptional regulator